MKTHALPILAPGMIPALARDCSVLGEMPSRAAASVTFISEPFLEKKFCLDLFGDGHARVARVRVLRSGNPHCVAVVPTIHSKTPLRVEVEETARPFGHVFFILMIDAPFCTPYFLYPRFL